MPSSRIQLVVFDWAGTIIDFGSCVPAATFVEVFKTHGVSVTTEEARRPMGTHKRDHLLAMLGDPDIGARWRARHGRDWTSADVDVLYQEIMPLQLARIDEHDTLVPHLLECANWLRRQGIRIGGSTGYFHAAARKCLDAAARQGFTLDASFCGDDVKVGRPAPWMIYRVMETLDIYPPDCVLKIGDTLIDIEEGHNAGVWSVAVTSSSSEMGLTLEQYQELSATECQSRLAAVSDKFRTAKPHAIIETLAEIPALVEDLNRRLGRGERP